MTAFLKKKNDMTNLKESKQFRQPTTGYKPLFANWKLYF